MIQSGVMDPVKKGEMGFSQRVEANLVREWRQDPGQRREERDSFRQKEPIRSEVERRLSQRG